MTVRLSVATMGVAGMAYIFNPLPVLVGFLVVVAGPVSWTAWRSHMVTNCGTIPPWDAEE